MNGSSGRAARGWCVVLLMVGSCKVSGSPDGSQSALPAASGSSPQAGEPRPAPVPSERIRSPSWLGRQYELDRIEKEGTFNVEPHHPVSLGLRHSTNPNDDSDPDQEGHVDASELQFTFSAKTKVAEDLVDDRLDVWVGYTQQGQWQTFESSGPLREIDYEPELMFTTRVDLPAGPLQWRMLNIAIDHQSNGDDDDLSRSWNRLYFQFGLENGPFALLVRPWIILSDSDNPDINKFMGYGDVTLRWGFDGYLAGLMVRNNLDLDENHGAFRVTIAAPTWTDRVKVYGSYFTGFGDTLFDYNHRQQSFVIGLMFTDWD